MLCEQCECIYINGLKCHEHGCPDAWKDYKMECACCGAEFKPKFKGQAVCGAICEAAYN